MGHPCASCALFVFLLLLLCYFPFVVCCFVGCSSWLLCFTACLPMLCSLSLLWLFLIVSVVSVVVVVVVVVVVAVVVVIMLSLLLTFLSLLS